jgi:hypothetical protein
MIWLIPWNFLFVKSESVLEVWGSFKEGSKKKKFIFFFYVIALKIWIIKIISKTEVNQKVGKHFLSNLLFYW